MKTSKVEGSFKLTSFEIYILKIIKDRDNWKLQSLSLRALITEARELNHDERVEAVLARVDAVKESK